MRTSLDVWLAGAITALPLTPWLLHVITLNWVLPVWCIAALASRRWRNPWLTFGWGLCTGLLWLTWHSHQSLAWQLPQSSWREPVSVTVQVLDPVQADELRWRIDGRIIAASQPELIGLRTRDRPKVRLHWYRPSGPMPQPGEHWQLEVRLRPLGGLLNQGAFNYQAWLVRHGYRASGTIASGQQIGGQLHWRYRLLQRLQDQFAPWHHQGVLLALAMGDRSQLDPTTWQVLQRTGVAHLVAISGLHLTLVFGFALYVGRIGLGVLWWCWPMRRGRQPAAHIPILLWAWLSAVGYAALAGFAVPTMRALALVTVFCGYRIIARRLSPFRLLLRAVVLVLLVDPLAWLDRGFWLSAGAVCAIMLWHWRLPQPVWSDWRGKVRGLWRLEVMLTLCLTPLTIAWFQGVSLVAPLTNLLAVPWVSLIILPLTLLSVGLTMLSQVELWSGLASWGQQVAGLASGLLHPLWWVLQWVGDQSWSWLPTGQRVLGLWLLLVLVVWYTPVRRQYWRYGGIALLGLALGTFWSVQRPPEWAVHVLDVGQGLAVVVQRREYALVFDAGPAYPSGFDLGEAVVVPFLQQQRLTPEYLVLSHAHQDHIGGAAAVQQAFPDLVTWGSGAGDWPCEHGQHWQWHGVQVRALARLPGRSYGPNNDSCVLQLEYAGQRLLLTGDIEEMSELRLYGRYGEALRSEVLVVPHHGSRTSSQPEFLDVVQPDLAVVSRGFLNRFGMPHPAVRRRYCAADIPLYDTGRSGQISLYWRGHYWQVVRYREDRHRRWYQQLPLEFPASCQDLA